jgi:hypothetical protein
MNLKHKWRETKDTPKKVITLYVNIVKNVIMDCQSNQNRNKRWFFYKIKNLDYINKFVSRNLISQKLYN